MALEETVKQLLQETYGDEVKIVDIKESLRRWYWRKKPLREPVNLCVGHKFELKQCTQYVRNRESQQGTKPGENFGSVIFALTVTIETKNHNQSKLNLISKSLPTSEFICTAFNVNVTFPKEAEFYQVVVPEYTKLLEENNIFDFKNVFPHFFGAKIEAKGDVIEKATLIMENIKPEGYQLRPKSEGLDLEHSTMVIRKIAQFHALGIALKFQKPEIYEKKIKKVGRPLKGGQDVDKVKVEIYTFMEQVLDYLKQIQEVEDLVPRLRKVMYDNFPYADMLERYKPREPFCTLVHNDLWLNNVMFKYDDNKPISVKLLDFQRTKIGSPISDLMLFLYVSTSLNVMKNNFDELLKYYHDNFSETLTRLGVSVEGLSWQNFEEELKYASEEVSFPVAMIRLIFIQVDCDVSEFEMESFGGIGGAEDENSRIRHIEVVKDLARRGWI